MMLTIRQNNAPTQSIRIAMKLQDFCQSSALRKVFFYTQVYRKKFFIFSEYKGKINFRECCGYPKYTDNIFFICLEGYVKQCRKGVEQPMNYEIILQ